MFIIDLYRDPVFCIFMSTMYLQQHKHEYWIDLISGYDER